MVRCNGSTLAKTYRKIKIGRLLADLGKSRTGNTEAVVNRQLPLTAIVIKDLLIG